MQSIAVYAPHWIGDGVLSLAALRALRTSYPDSRITVVTRPWVRELYEVCEEVTDTVVYDPKDGVRGFLGAASELRRQRYDLGVLFPNAFRAALLFYWAGIAERWGYASDGRSLLLTKKVPPAPRPFGRHQVYYYLDLLRGLGFSTDTPRIEVQASRAMLNDAARLLESAGWDTARPLVGIHPGSTNSRAKRWFGGRFAEVGDRFAHSHKAQIVVFGGPEERDLAEEVVSKLTPDTVIDVSGKTSLGVMMGALSHLGLFLSNDSGPMHLASALNVPTLAVFGPTDDRETGPFSKRARVVRKNVDCSPCLFRECPIDHRCMDRVDSETVYAQASDLLEELASAADSETTSERPAAETA